MLFQKTTASAQTKVQQQLEIKFINYYLNNLYNLNSIYEVAKFILTRSAALGLGLNSNTKVSLGINGMQLPDANSVKIKALMVAIASLREIVKNTIQSQTQLAETRPRNIGATAVEMSAPGVSVCDFCRLSGHFIQECEVVAEYTRTGKNASCHEMLPKLLYCSSRDEL